MRASGCVKNVTMHLLLLDFVYSGQVFLLEQGSSEVEVVFEAAATVNR